MSSQAESPCEFYESIPQGEACLVSRLLSVEPLLEPQVRVLGPQCTSAGLDETHSGGTV